MVGRIDEWIGVTMGGCPDAQTKKYEWIRGIGMDECMVRCTGSGIDWCIDEVMGGSMGNSMDVWMHVRKDDVRLTWVRCFWMIRDHSDHGASKADKSLTKVDSSVSLIHHDPRDLGSLILFRTIPKERTLNNPCGFMASWLMTGKHSKINGWYFMISNCCINKRVANEATVYQLLANDFVFIHTNIIHELALWFFVWKVKL